MSWFSSRWYLRALLVGLAVVIVSLGINPSYREDWLLENVLTLLALIGLTYTHRRWPLSNASYTLLVVFAVLHSIGSHYTYSEVPYDAWLRRWAGTDLAALFNLERNHYDRVVHFAFGLLWFHPLRELILRSTRVGPVTSYLYPLALLAMVSHCYELIEWGAAEVFGGDLGMAYLGTQGDVWDAQKDMALALLGSSIALLAELIGCREAGAQHRVSESW